MTNDEAKQAILSAGAAISTAAMILRPHLELFKRFQREANDMSSFGHVVNPTLFRDPERRAVEAVVGPLFGMAQDFVTKHDLHVALSRGALAKVQR